MAALAANATPGPPFGHDHNLTTDQIGRQRWQPINVTLGPAVDDRDIVFLDVALFIETLPKFTETVYHRPGDLGSRNA